jgi:hypothetical protein
MRLHRSNLSFHPWELGARPNPTCMHVATTTLHAYARMSADDVVHAGKLQRSLEESSGPSLEARLTGVELNLEEVDTLCAAHLAPLASTMLPGLTVGMRDYSTIQHIMPRCLQSPSPPCRACTLDSSSSHAQGLACPEQGGVRLCTAMQ